jgi:hypothetical protein
MPSSQTKALGWSLARWSIACISGGRWPRAGRQCRRMHHEAQSTAATRLRREHGAGGGVLWVAFPNTRWTMRYGIVFSPASAHIGAPRPVKEGAPLNWRPSADAVAGNGPPLSWRPSADTVAEGVAPDHWRAAPHNHCGFALPDVR